MYSQLTIIGRLARDPEMRYTPNGSAVTELSIPVSRKFKGADDQLKEVTTWYRVTVWGKQAESVNQYTAKGKTVLVVGELVPDEKTGGPRVFTRKDGTPGASFEVRADTVRFLSPKGEGEGGSGANVGNEELPF